MTSTTWSRRLERLVSFTLAAWLCAHLPAGAQTATTGTVSGRVQNSAAKLSLENARVRIEGTNREAFTDVFGEYRFPDLTAGEIKLTAFYTGLTPQTISVTVSPGQTVQLDFALMPASMSAGARTQGGDIHRERRLRGKRMSDFSGA